MPRTVADISLLNFAFRDIGYWVVIGCANCLGHCLISFCGVDCEIDNDTKTLADIALDGDERVIVKPEVAADNVAKRIPEVGRKGTIFGSSRFQGKERYAVR
jgi:hypothetical protein